MAEIITSRSVGFEEIRDDLLDVVRNLPDGAKWDQIFGIGEAQTLIELLAGFGSMLQYNSIMVARESGITMGARLKSTIYGAADILGYPINRKQALRFKLQISSTVDVWLDRKYPIGTLGGAMISLVESAQVNIGNNTLECILGTWETLEHRVLNSGDYYECRWRFDDVDNIGPTEVDQIDNKLCQVFVDGLQMKDTRYLELLGHPESIGGRENDCFTRSLAYSFSVFFGTDGVGYVPSKNANVVVEYVHVNETKAQVVMDNVSLNNDKLQPATLTVITPAYNSDSLQKICFLAPRYHSARRMMVNKYDHEYCLMSYPGIVSAKWVHGYCTVNGKKVYASNTGECTLVSGTWTKSTSKCCNSTLAYLFEDKHLAGPNESEQIYRYLDQFRHEGDEITLINSERVPLTRKYTVLMTKNADADSLTRQIKSLINQYCYSLGSVFREEELNDKIRDLKGIERLYPLITSGDFRVAEHQYLELEILQIDYKTDLDSLMKVGV